MMPRNFVFFILLLITAPALSKPDDNCHPKANAKLAQYIIGYGSLMETASKKASDASSGENKPVLIDHYQRGWFAEGLSTGFSTTYLGVIKKPNAHFNGSVFKLASVNSLKNYDRRERYYCRVLVPDANIHLLVKQKLPRGQYWIYELKPELMASPTARYPIVQSYVDIFLAGCLEIEEKYHLKNFAAGCVNTTFDWSLHWVNDRIYPRRPTAYQAKALVIDALLQQQIPIFFNQIQLEHNS
ncbi:MAG: hypothetical protein RLZZ225_151 [Pseudomonadota bacterium]|jgi:hypothetical protein